MTNRKKLYFSAHPIQTVHLYKEEGEIPYYFSREFGYDSILDDYVGTDFNRQFRLVELHRYKHFGFIKEIQLIFNLFSISKNIDILCLMHASPRSFVRACTYLLGGGKGHIYIKLDAEPSDTGNVFEYNNYQILKKIYFRVFGKMVDIITIETDKAYQQTKHSIWKDYIGEKLFLMPNGFDTEILNELNISVNPVSKKERIILTAGRIGTHQKNTELLLEILESVDLKDWKVYISGPIMESFEETINQFYSRNPYLKDSVIFTGQIEQSELYELYNRARIFCLTSRHESFGFVLSEAAYMNNYIITTDVGVAKEIVPVFGGDIIYSGSVDDFVSAINKIISLPDDKLNKIVPEVSKDRLTWKYILENNQGIQKLISMESKKRHPIMGILLKILTPFSLLFLIFITLLEYTYHNHILNRNKKGL